MNPRVVRVKARDNYELELEFANSEKKLFDVKPYLQYPIYEPLQDTNIFAKAMVSMGTVVWNNDIDFCPDTLFLDAKEIET